MKFRNGFKIGLVLAVFVLLYPSTSWGQTKVLLYDDFDDGEYDGWTVTNWKGEPRPAPDVVPSPEGYSLRGVGSGYSTPPPVDAWISHPVSISDVTELKIEMRAKSGPQWPNQAAVYLTSSSDYYAVDDFGEAGENETADLQRYVNGSHVWLHRYPIGSRAFEWHDFAWTRDSDGWWSLSIDGNVEAANFYRDNQLTSFDRVGIMLMRNQSEIEWVRISGIFEVIEAAIDIDPDTLNLNSKGKWITCYIELPEDCDVDDIDISTILLNYQIPAEPHPTCIGDYDDDGVPDLMVKFDRSDVQQILQVGDNVEITVTGELNDGKLFEGMDTIRVIDKGGKK